MKGEPAGFLRSLQFVLTQFVLSDQGKWKSQRELLRTPSRIRVDSRRRRRRKNKKKKVKRKRGKREREWGGETWGGERGERETQRERMMIKES